MSTSDWPVLESRCDPGGEPYKRTAEANERLVADLRERLAAAARGGPERARARHVQRGKLLPRDRVDTLLDPGGRFLELSPLAATGMYDDRPRPPGSSPAWGGSPDARS